MEDNSQYKPKTIEEILKTEVSEMTLPEMFTLITEKTKNLVRCDYKSKNWLDILYDNWLVNTENVEVYTSHTKGRCKVCIYYGTGGFIEYTSTLATSPKYDAMLYAIVMYIQNTMR